ncbi:MAG: hypothetical protein HY820_20185 [Acidobacteria bacterium]|nr:hypothetical protein [Acidobacteriota bacterium]
MTDALLRRLGIDPKRFWLLLGLFRKLSDRKELLNQQLGYDGAALRFGALLNAGLGTLMGGLLVLVRPAWANYVEAFLFLTALVLAVILMAETAHTLVNPEEGMVLVHLPIDGATYTAAKLIHLVRVVVYMAGGLNAIPAFLGLATNDASLYVPIYHLASVLVLGICIALACCALFGWMMRFVPPSRMKAVAQLAMWLPFLLLMPQLKVMPLVVKLWKTMPGAGPWLGAAAVLVLLASVVFGLRSLSVDYLIRVTRIVQGGSKKRAPGARNRGLFAMPGKLVARWLGGPAARAGFAYLFRMVARDWQFRRQIVSVLPSLILVPLSAQSFKNPFDTEFSTVHLFPHGFGALTLFVCQMLKPGAHPKAVWTFQLSPASAFPRFARGIYGALWFLLVVAPHAVLIPTALWFWPAQDALLFGLYSIAVTTLYLSLSLSVVDGLPFCHPAEAAQTYWLFPVMLIGGITAAIVVAGQHFILFRSEVAVLVVALVVAGAALDLARRSVTGLAGAMRFYLSTLSEEKTNLYQEVG